MPCGDGVIGLPEGGTDRVAAVSPAEVPASHRSRQLRSGHPAPPSPKPHYQTSHAHPDEPLVERIPVLWS